MSSAVAIRFNHKNKPFSGLFINGMSDAAELADLITNISKKIYFFPITPFGVKAAKEYKQKYSLQTNIPLEDIRIVKNIEEYAFQFAGMAHQFFDNSGEQDEPVYLFFENEAVDLSEHTLCRSEGSCELLRLDSHYDSNVNIIVDISIKDSKCAGDGKIIVSMSYGNGEHIYTGDVSFLKPFIEKK